MTCGACGSSFGESNIRHLKASSEAQPKSCQGSSVVLRWQAPLERKPPAQRSGKAPWRPNAPGHDENSSSRCLVSQTEAPTCHMLGSSAGLVLPPKMGGQKSDWCNSLSPQLLAPTFTLTRTHSRFGGNLCRPEHLLVHSCGFSSSPSPHAHLLPPARCPKNAPAHRLHH